MSADPGSRQSKRGELSFAGRWSVREGGISVNDRKVTDTKAVLDSAELADGISLKKGKKTFVRLIHKD